MRYLLLVAALLVACGDNYDVPADAKVVEVDAKVDAPATGCTSATDCNDNNGCTTDTCNSAHECEHVLKSIDDQIACTTDVCNPTTGEVTHTPVDMVCELDGKTCTVAKCSA